MSDFPSMSRRLRTQPVRGAPDARTLAELGASLPDGEAAPVAVRAALPREALAGQGCQRGRAEVVLGHEPFARALSGATLR